MGIQISGLWIDDLGPSISRTVTNWGWWCFGQRWRRLWCRKSASVVGRCTSSFASPLCLRILCHDILPRKGSGCLALTKHSWVSFYRSLHHMMPRKPHTPLLLISDLGTRLLSRNCVFSTAVCEVPLLATFATFKARRMSDYSHCTRPPCLAIVADMLETCKEFFAACNDEIRWLPHPYTLP